METFYQPIISSKPSECQQELVERLNIMRRNGGFCDVKVEVKDEVFNAHKAVLAAASPFFFTLLASDMRESKEQRIKIKLEEATVSVMEDVLQYVYTGNVSISQEFSPHILIATADYLFLSGLKTGVQRYLMKMLTTENCVFNYYFADKYQCVELRKEALAFINLNFTAVMETDDFLSLDVKQVMEWVSSDDITVNAEEEVFKGIVKWVYHNRSEREVEFPSLLRQVRLISMPHDVLRNELLNEELVAKNAALSIQIKLDAILLRLSAFDGDQANFFQQPRKCLETHTDGIFVCGGTKCLCYFPQQNKWYQLANMSFYHDCNHSPAQCRGRVYIPCSESDKLGNSKLMEYYIPTTNSWGAVQLATTFTCTAALKGYLYATCDSFNQRNGLYKFDPDKNYCDKLKAPSSYRCINTACIVADEEYLYVIGGSSLYGGKPLSTTEKFDPSANEWQRVAPINQARFDAFGATMNGKVYIAGGRLKYKTVVSSCEVYDPVINEWQLMPSLKVPRMCASMVCYKEKLYVLGGISLDVRSRRWSQTRVLSVEVFDSEENAWKEKSVVPVQCWETTEEEQERNKFKACFARLCKAEIAKLEPLNM